MVDKKYYKIHTLPSLFKWWLRFWPVVEEDPWEAGHVQVLWIYQVRERTSLLSTFPIMFHLVRILLCACVTDERCLTM